MTTDQSEKDYSHDRLVELCDRAKQEGTRMRRHRQAGGGAALLVLIAAAVVGLVAFGQSGSTSTKSSLRSVTAGPYSDVAWRQVEYFGLNFANVAYPRSLECGSNSTPTSTGYVFPVDVQQVAYVRPAGTSSRIALVLVRCMSGTPTPSALYAFDSPRGTTGPHLFQVLLAPPSAGTKTLWYASGFSSSNNEVTLTLKGVRGNAAICCPNVSATAIWTWNGTRFQEVGSHAPKALERQAAAEQAAAEAAARAAAEQAAKAPAGRAEIDQPPMTETAPPVVAEPPAASSCDRRDLKPSWSGVGDGASGILFYVVNLLNVSATTCATGGYIGVSAYDPAGDLIAASESREQGLGGPNPLSSLSVAPGSSVHFTIGLPEVDEATGGTPCSTTVGALHLIPPNETTDVQIATPISTGYPSLCDSTFMVGPLGSGAINN